MRRALVVLAIGSACRGTPLVAPSSTGGGEGGAIAIAPVPDAAAAPPTSVPRAPHQRVAVAYLAAEDAWRVTWTFVEPTSGIVFDRRNPGLRHARWQAGDGLRWSIEDGHEVLRPADGIDRTRFEARFATDDETASRAPPLNLRWRDGGRMLFTGELGVHALACAASVPLERCPRRDVGGRRGWRFTADDGRGLRVLGTTGRGALDWDEPAGDLRGTYLYAGDRAPIESPLVTTIVDAGLPAWLAAETERHLPRLLAAHAERTGLALPWKPLVLVSRGDGPSWQRALRGRTLPGLVQLEARGGRWDRRTPGNEQAWLELLAHEAFHFWNGQVARRADRRDEWWSEGASSYVGGRTLRDAGLLDARRYQRRIRRVAAGCLETLRGPLLDEGAEDSYYTCGELVHFLVDAHQRRRGGIDPIYATLFAEAQARGTYSTADFLALLAARGAAPAFVADLRQILDRGLGPAPATFVARLLGAAGVPTRVVPARGRQPARLAAAAVAVKRPPARPPRRSRSERPPAAPARPR